MITPSSFSFVLSTLSFHRTTDFYHLLYARNLNSSTAVANAVSQNLSNFSAPVKQPPQAISTLHSRKL